MAPVREICIGGSLRATYKQRSARFFTPGDANTQRYKQTTLQGNLKIALRGGGGGGGGGVTWTPAEGGRGGGGWRNGVPCRALCFV